MQKLWGSVIFSKCSKLNTDFGNAVKTWEKMFSFLDSSDWIGCGNISSLSREYLLSGVKVLTNGLKVLDTIKAEIKKLRFSQSVRIAR